MTWLSSTDPATPLRLTRPQSPYPGLRPFEKREWTIFFGRERMTNDVIDQLADKQLVVVHGDSGCGKSSLVRAGVLAQLELEHCRSGLSWRTCAMRPGGAPIDKLAQALAGLVPNRSTELLDEIHNSLTLGRGAARELAKHLRHDPRTNLCVLVDQFEELFSFARQRGRDEAQLFVDILVGLQEDPPPGLYAILTMRSEFLGHCARFEGFAEAVNRTQYLLPRMERRALLRAIRDPAPLCDGKVDRTLAERIITDAGGGQDQLPLIQHGLMLLSRRKMQAWKSTGQAWYLGLEDYVGAGGLVDLLSRHADEVMAKAAPDSARQKIVEHLFRALTDISSEGHAIRRPQTFAQLQAVTGADEAELRAIIDRFRAEGTSFLTPYADGPIRPDTQIDISHEALIRCWKKIADDKESWQQQEFQDGLIWKSLQVQAKKGEILSAETTTSRDEWLKSLPSSAWTERYGGGWDNVKQLMDASHEARERAEREVNRALRNESLLRAEQARGELDGGFPVTAIQLGLAGLPQHPDAPDARPWLPPLAGVVLEALGYQRERQVLRTRERSCVFDAAFSPDGSRIVSGSDDWTVRLWNPERPKRQCLRVLRGHEGEVTVAGFSPNGARIVSGSSDNTVRVWDARSGEEVLVLRGHKNRISAAGFSPEGMRIVRGPPTTRFGCGMLNDRGGVVCASYAAMKGLSLPPDSRPRASRS